jgi:D-alanine-D-alanine ligase-like ATP-grasp enzyme
MNHERHCKKSNTQLFQKLGDLTSREVSQRCDNKQVTKVHLIKHHIAVPEGVVVQHGDTNAVATFLQRHPGRHFILKPLDGTRGQGVYRNLPPKRVMPTLKDAAKRPHLLEEYVPGPQYRVIVVSGRYVASWENRLPQVTGDGNSDIATLMAQARERSHQLTHPSLVTDRLTLKPDVVDYLAQQGLVPESVPAAGQTVILWPEPDDDYGAEAVDCTHTLPEPVRLVAIKAAEALALSVTGLDLIFEQNTGRIVVLEANQMPMIRAMTFPYDGQGQGNRVAEAIIDHYFPGSINNPRHTKASFDFMKVCETLQSGVVGEVTLPVLGPDWVHKRFQVAAASRDNKTLPTLRNALFTYGIHAQLVNSDKGDLIVDVVAPQGLYAAFVAALGGVGGN